MSEAQRRIAKLSQLVENRVTLLTTKPNKSRPDECLLLMFQLVRKDPEQRFSLEQAKAAIDKILAKN